MDDASTTLPLEKVEPFRSLRDEIDDIMLEARDVATLQRLVFEQHD